MKKLRLRVKNFADAMKQLRTAHTVNAANTAEIAKLTECLAGAEDGQKRQSSLRYAAEADAKAARTQFDDLKKKLYDAEIEISNLRGFIARVREDDAVRDPLVEVDDQLGKRQVTKRFPSNTPISYTMQHHDKFVSGSMNGLYGQDREKPKHWTSY